MSSILVQWWTYSTEHGSFLSLEEKKKGSLSVLNVCVIGLKITPL